jgi:hypothetical protein
VSLRGRSGQSGLRGKRGEEDRVIRLAAHRGDGEGATRPLATSESVDCWEVRMLSWHHHPRPTRKDGSA